MKGRLLLFALVGLCASTVWGDGSTGGPSVGAQAPAAGPVSTTAVSSAPDSATSTAVVMEPYTVTAHKGSQTAMRMDVPVKDIPASIQVVNSEDMDQHAATDWVDALDYSSGIMALSTYGGFDSATVRGLPEPDLVVLNDGIRDDTYNIAYSSPQGNLGGIDSLQILKGPASMLYGTGALAGVINIVHKQPTDTPACEAEVGYGSYNTLDAMLGAGGPLPGTPVLYRLDVASTSTDGFRQNPQQSVSASLGLVAKLWDGFTASYRGTVDETRITDPDPGIPVENSGQIPGNVPLNLNYGNPNDFINYQDLRDSLTLRQDLGEHLYLSTLVSYQTKGYEYLESEDLTLQSDNATINRSYLYFDTNYSSWLSQTEAGWDFDGPVPQKGLVGYDFSYWDNGSDSDPNLEYGGPANDNVNIFTGGMGVAPAVTPNPTSEQWDSQYTNSVYAQDYLTLRPWAKLLLAGRFDSYSRAENTDTLQPGGPASGEPYDSYNSGSVSVTANSAPTWRAGLVLSPLDWLNVYGTYTTAFIPTFVNDSAVPTIWKPETGQMVETGVKWESGDGHDSGTAAWFADQEDNIIYQTGVAADGGTLYSQNDTRSAQGFDLQMDSRVASIFRVKGGYTYVDAYMNAEQDGGGDLIGRPYAVPMDSADIWGLLDLSHGFTLGLGGRYVGQSYGNDVGTTFGANTSPSQVALPAYAVADAGLYYEYKRNWGVDLAVNNILNLQRYYVSSIFDSTIQLYPGEPLNLRLSTHVSF